jgi:hypothetical protein
MCVTASWGCVCGTLTDRASSPPPGHVASNLFSPHALYLGFDRTHASRRYTVSLYNQGVLNKGLESFEQLLLESGESLLPAVWRLLLCGRCVEYH